MKYYEGDENYKYWKKRNIKSKDIYIKILSIFKDFEIFYSTSSNDKGFHTLVFSIIKNVLTKKSKNDINEFPITSEYDIFLKKYITDEVLCNKIIKTQYIIKLDTLKYKIDILKNLSNFYKYNII